MSVRVMPVLSHSWYGTETEMKIALAAILAQPLTNNPGHEVVVVNSKKTLKRLSCGLPQI